jgi:CDP-paratose 2-epimerase
LELLRQIEQIHGEAPEVRFAGWRQGDQRYYVSDIRAIQAATGWNPRIGVNEGLTRLYAWLRQQSSPVQPKVTV